MWLLGAGASAAAGIPTAWDMIWDFKQQLYVSRRRVSPRLVSDLANPAIRDQLQSFISENDQFPLPDSPEEYASLFEAAYPNENDRRAYIEAKIEGGKPSYGHLALAAMMKGGITKLVWTTNFDPLVADACAKVYDGTGKLTTVALDAPDLAVQTISSERWPAEIKLHGDFRSRRLKNTAEELRSQDARLRQSLVSCCGRFGLAVAGYSGRDNSVMASLSDALKEPTPFPGGLFWLHRGDGPPLAAVSDLIEQAQAANVEAGLVRIDNFDETLRDLIRLFDGLDTTSLDAFAASRKIWTPAPRIGGTKGFPVIRLNALPFRTMPTVCRRVECGVGGQADARQAVETAGVDVLVARTRAGVLAFGTDADVKAAFTPFGITNFDLHAFETRRLRNDGAERGLLREALSRGLAREHGLLLVRRRSADHLAPADPSDPKWQPLKKLVSALSGKVPGQPDVTWREGISLRLDWANDQLWLLIEPRTIFEGSTQDTKAATTDFARERTVRRYNRPLNDLIAFWSSFLANGGGEIRALNVSVGVDASFQLHHENAFSRRVIS